MDRGTVQARIESLRREPLVLQLAEACGKRPCHLVGGTVRDCLLGRPAADLDIVVSGGGRALSERLAALLPARMVLLGGEDFAAIRLISSGGTIDLWDRGRASLHDDLARRDLTINALALPLAKGALVDPFAGLADLGAGRLRATTPRGFAEDALRVLRLARLAAQLPGFAADGATLKLARRAASRLPGIAAERVRTELATLFAQPRALLGLETLLATGVYPALWVDPRALGEMQQQAPPVIGWLTGLPAAVADLNAWQASLGDEDLAEARLALTFLAFAPQARALAALTGFRDAGYLTRSTATRIASLLSFDRLPREELARRRFLHAAGPQWATVLAMRGARAGARGRHRWRTAAQPIARLAATEGPAIFRPPRLLDGHDLQELLGMPAGPAIGRALAALATEQVEGKVRTRDEAIAWIERAYSSSARASSTSSK